MASALILIDVQTGFDNPVWGARNNPQAEANAARLLAEWRKWAAPICHIRHVSLEAGSPLSGDGTGASSQPLLLLATPTQVSAFGFAPVNGLELPMNGACVWVAACAVHVSRMAQPPLPRRHLCHRPDGTVSVLHATCWRGH